LLLLSECCLPKMLGRMHRRWSSSTSTLATRIAQAIVGGTRLPPPSAGDAPATLADALAVQAAVAQAVVSATKQGQIAGWKIGATNDAAMQRMGLHAPFYGPLFASNIQRAGTTHSASGMFRVRGVEAEYVFQLARDIPLKPSRGFYTPEELVPFVGKIYPGIEVCGSRFSENVPPLVSIADQASHGMLVIDPSMTIDPACWPTGSGEAAGSDAAAFFSDRPVTMAVDGRVVASGDGRAVLGNPLHALAFLVNELAASGATLRQGDLVTSGTMTGLAPVPDTCTVTATFAGAGALTVALQ